MNKISRRDALRGVLAASAGVLAFNGLNSRLPVKGIQWASSQAASVRWVTTRT